MTDAPLSRPFVVSSAPAEGEVIEIEAGPAELERLAAENEVESVERLFARLTVRPFGREGLSVTGDLEAAATRLCVVTLEPFVEAVHEEIDVRFVPESSVADESEDDDPPDTFQNGVVDLGAVAAEFFTLGLALHPRKPGVAFEEPKERDPSDSPFAALRGLGRRNEPS
ncbi:YceD family protein [Hansschlegelia zhihuaiae]|uniref:YceD family protein n=1 Tax=Hansschlegelia zhihuaiae TaxID=405005 RepID=UPI0013E8BF4F|nr:YceD family protein [Hansschlegelia zhihuaiae]